MRTLLPQEMHQITGATHNITQEFSEEDAPKSELFPMLFAAIFISTNIAFWGLVWSKL